MNVTPSTRVTRHVATHCQPDGSWFQQWEAAGPTMAIRLYEVQGRWTAADGGGWIEGTYGSADAAIDAATQSQTGRAS